MRVAQVEQMVTWLIAQAEQCGDRNGAEALRYALDLVAERREEERAERNSTREEEGA